jgi:hypothetical protein
MRYSRVAPSLYVAPSHFNVAHETEPIEPILAALPSNYCVAGQRITVWYGATKPVVVNTHKYSSSLK